MRRLLVLAALLVPAGAGRADESDDELARRLVAVVRDFRLATAARAEAARTLGKLGPRAAVAVPEMIAVFDRLRGTEQTPLQEAIVVALGQIGGPARPALTSLPKGLGRTIDIDLAIRRSTDQILAAPEALNVDLLVQQLFSRDPSTRLKATKGLADLGPAAAAAAPDLDALRGDPDPDVRRAASDALARVSAPPP